MTQNEALDILKLGHNVFLTGSAGSGKTFLLNKYIGYLKGKGIKIGVTASTGVAATHMCGITVHSWSGMGIKDKLSDEDMQKILKKRHLARRINKTNVLIIDEISMLHHFQLDLVDEICKAFKQNNKPFGGMQVVLCGDFFQLPPVGGAGNKAFFANESKIWNEMGLRVCYLEEQYRHNDVDLTKILNDIRSNSAGKHTLDSLRKRYKADLVNLPIATNLYTHNIDADLINNKELEKLKGETEMYDMSSNGNKKLVDVLKKYCLAPEKLVLKKGAVVMFVKNDFEIGYVNGTLGKIDGFDREGRPIVKTLKGKMITASPKSWTIEEDGKIKAEIAQIPLRLAWAITVHKSQGMTLDAAEIDLSKSFVEGMGYVALSRVRALSGLRLMGLNDMALRVNKDVLVLNEDLVELSKLVSLQLKRSSAEEREREQTKFLESILPVKKSELISTYEKTKLLFEKKLSIEEISKRRGLGYGTILSHLEKLIECDKGLDLSHIQFPNERFLKIKVAFEKSKDFKLAPVREILEGDYSYEELRLVRLLMSNKLVASMSDFKAEK